MEEVFANAGAGGYVGYPACRLAPPSGRMNDPNGLIHYRERLTLWPVLTHTSVEVFAGDGQTEGSHSLSSRFCFDGMEKCIDFYD